MAKVISQTTVTLELTRFEAETLMAVTRSVGGDPGKSRRGYIDAIRHALLAAGVTEERGDGDNSGSIHFSDSIRKAKG